MYTLKRLLIIAGLGILANGFLAWLGGEFVVLPMDENKRQTYVIVNGFIDVFTTFALGYFAYRAIVLWRRSRS